MQTFFKDFRLHDRSENCHLPTRQISQGSHAETLPETASIGRYASPELDGPPVVNRGGVNVRAAS